MSIDSIVPVQVTATAATPSRANFGTPLLAVFHEHNVDRVREYSSLAAMVSDGYASWEPAYRMATAAFAQTPRVPKVKIGRRALGFTQVIDLTPSSPSNGKVYSLTVNDEAASYTADGVDVLADVCTKLAKAINGGLDADVDAIHSGGSTAGLQTLTTFNGVVGATAMSPPRSLAFVFSNHTDWDATTITVTGKDAMANTITETFAVPNGGNATVTGIRLFAQVTEISIPAQTGAGGTFTFGTTARVDRSNLASIITNGNSTGGTQNLTGASLNGTTGDDAMAPPRAMAFSFSPHADWDATTAVIYGTDIAGNSISENFSIPNGGNAIVTGTKLFKTVTQVTIPAQSGTGGHFIVGERARFTASGASGTKVVVTTTSVGMLTSFEDITRDTITTVKDQTTNPGIATDLDAIFAADADWYGLLLDSNSEAECNAAAAWTEAKTKLFGAQTADSATYDAGSTTDLAADLETAAYGRTFCEYHPDIATLTSWLAAAHMGDRFVDDPGSDSWAYKTLAGVDVYSITDTQKTAIHGKNCGTYTTIAGVNVTEQGKVASGEWVDVVRGIDWNTSRMQERLFALLASVRKVPYTDRGVNLVKAEVLAQLRDAVTVGLFAADPEPTVTAPLVADVATVDRQARLLPDVNFTATLAGAVHTIEVQGTITV